MKEKDIRDQLIVRVGKACNFKCNFCNVGDNESHVKMKESVDDIVRNFHYKLKYSQLHDSEIVITISGGEPSIFQKETIFALKYIKKILDKKSIIPTFDIQTNASNIDLKFAQQLKDNGIHLALVSFHTSDKNIFEEVIGVEYSNYHKTIEGIKNLHQVGIKIDTNTILSNQTKSDFYNTIVYLEKNFPYIESFNIGVIQPHGEALKILDEIIPVYQEIAPIYNKTIFYLHQKKRNIVSHYVGLPPCYLGKTGVSLEVGSNIEFRKSFSFSQKCLINEINDENKLQTIECNGCLYNNVCSGIWKKYIGFQVLQPYPYARDFFFEPIRTRFSYKIRNKNEDVHDIYHRNYKQVIISASLGTKDEIYDLLSKFSKKGFFEITLLVDQYFDVSDENLLQTGVTNIQIDIQYIDIESIVSILDFSKMYGPQFRIDLDIFIYNYNKKTLVNIVKMIKLLPSNFLKLYFINNFMNKEIYHYQNLLKNVENFGDNIFTVNFYKKLLFKK